MFAGARFLSAALGMNHELGKDTVRRPCLGRFPNSINEDAFAYVMNVVIRLGTLSDVTGTPTRFVPCSQLKKRRPAISAARGHPKLIWVSQLRSWIIDLHELDELPPSWATWNSADYSV